MKKIKMLPIILILILLVGCGNTTIEPVSNTETTTIVMAEQEESTTIYEETTKELKNETEVEETTENKKTRIINVKDIPEYTGNPYIVINNNIPFFTDEEITSTSYESYSELDSRGRCGVAIACVGKDIMPTEERGSIGQVKPSGWKTVKYDIVDGKYLYNRCHLIGYQLTGENANEKNLITGTRYFNVDGMLPFEDLVSDYVKETNNHVMYRVTPLYSGFELVARGVLMEGYSVEDDGAGVSFNVFCYNVQPGIDIDYSTGESWLSDELPVTEKATKEETTKKNYSNVDSDSSTEYVLNMNSYKFHYPDCGSVKLMSESNKGYYTGDRKDLIEQGYEPCGNCNP